MWVKSGTCVGVPSFVKASKIHHRCSSKVYYAKILTQPHLGDIFEYNYGIQKQKRGVLLGLSQYGFFKDFFESLSVNSLKGDLSINTTFNPHILIGQYL